MYVNKLEKQKSIKWVKNKYNQCRVRMSEYISYMDGFCDDGYYSDTPDQIAMRESAAEWMARKLPITAAALKINTSNLQPTPPRRQRIVLSESPTPTQKISEDACE